MFFWNLFDDHTPWYMFWEVMSKNFLFLRNFHEPQQMEIILLTYEIYLSYINY